MAYTPRLLDQIVNLTSLRDVELLEFSLLKTVDNFVHPLQLSIVKVDFDNNPRKIVELRNGLCEIIKEGLNYPHELKSAMDHMDSCEASEHTVSVDKGILSVYCLHREKRSSSYLVILFAQPLSDIDAHMISGLLQINQNYCKLLNESQKDQLTGLANRKTFEDTITKVYELIFPEPKNDIGQPRTDEPEHFWLAMIDIDHFKKVNDSFGHLYGDEVLLMVAQIIQAEFRDNDMAFRFGGEEFVVILRSHNIESCRTALERLRNKIADYHFAKAGQVTISIGATQLAHEVFHVTLMNYADQALYYSKNNGRNQVSFFEEMVEAGVAERETITDGAIHVF